MTQANATLRIRNIAIEDLDEILDLIKAGSDGVSAEIFAATPPVGTHDD